MHVPARPWSRSPPVPVPVIGKLPAAVWLVVAGMSLCRGQELPGVPSRSAVEKDAEMAASSCEGGVLSPPGGLSWP